MRLAPNFDRVPHVVERHLLPHERQVLTVRFHPAILTVASLMAVGGLIAAVVLSFLNLSGDALAIVWCAWGLAFLHWLYRVVSWLESYMAVTAQRIVMVTGFLTRDVEMVPLGLATQLRYRRSALGRVLGYGQFILEGAYVNQRMRSINYLPYPEQLLLEVTALIYRDYGDADEDWPEAGASDEPLPEQPDPGHQVDPE